MTKCFIPRHFMQRGFSYVEVLLSVLLIAILLVPALQALSNAIAGSSSNLAARQFALRSKLEEVLSQPFGALDAETQPPGTNTVSSVSATFSDASRTVVLYRFNAASNVLSNDDTGLLHVDVYFAAEGSDHALSTLAGKWW